MKYCVTCDSPATQSINTDNQIEPTNLCEACFNQVLDNSIQELVDDGIISKSYDYNIQDYVYRLKEDA